MNNLDLMWKRLEYQGGMKQEDRMIMDKYRTFLKTLKYSYQGCDVSLAQFCEECLQDGERFIPGQPRWRALINPDKNKPDYDDKILSIDYASEYDAGDVFRWINTDTYWLIYLKELTEDAYFRGEIRRCNYQLKFKDDDGNTCVTWAAIRGPVETQIESIQKNQVRIDTPNLSLNILMPRNDKTIKAFQRYKEFLFQGLCWRVEAPNVISPRNIIEINTEEYYIDRDTDDVSNELKDGLVIEPIDPSPDTLIQGDTFIKPGMVWTFTAPRAGGHWAIVESDVPVELVCHNQTVDITWKKMTSGQFTLHWWDDEDDTTKTIIVESLI